MESSAKLGLITILTIKKLAPGMLGKLGLNTTTIVQVPVAGVILASMAVGYGLLKGAKKAKIEHPD